MKYANETKELVKKFGINNLLLKMRIERNKGNTFIQLFRIKGAVMQIKKACTSACTLV